MCTQRNIQQLLLLKLLFYSTKDQLNHYGAFIKSGDNVTLGVIFSLYNFILERN